MTAERNRDGAWMISSLVRGYLVTRRYYGFTKREAIRAFRAEVERGEA